MLAQRTQAGPHLTCYSLIGACHSLLQDSVLSINTCRTQHTDYSTPQQNFGDLVGEKSRGHVITGGAYRQQGREIQESTVH